MGIRLIACVNFRRRRANRPAMNSTKFRRAQNRSTGSQCRPSAWACARSELATHREAYRVVYIANLPDAIHVLHAFQKKTQKTAKRDFDLASARLKELKRGKQR